MPEQNHEGRTVLVEKISAQLSTFTTAVTSEVKNNLSTRNVLAETTVAGLLNRIFGWKLVNANAIRNNFPAVDLVDMNARVSVQVTSTNNLKKIDHTLEKFREHNLSADFDRLYVVIITADGATDSMNARTLDGIFCGKDDIWNIPPPARQNQGAGNPGSGRYPPLSGARGGKGCGLEALPLRPAGK